MSTVAKIERQMLKLLKYGKKPTVRAMCQHKKGPTEYMKQF